MKRLAGSTGEQTQNCFPTDLLLSGRSTHEIHDKTSFHTLWRNQDVARWHTCVTNSHLCICGRSHHAFQDACSQFCRRHVCQIQSTRTARVIRQHVKSRDEKRNEMEGKKKETKQKKLQTFQISAVGLVCMCIFFSLSPQDGRRGGWGGAYQNESLQQFPTNSIVITSIPLPTVFLDVLTQAKHRDASDCMTN